MQIILKMQNTGLTMSPFIFGKDGGFKNIYISITIPCILNLYFLFDLL